MNLPEIHSAGDIAELVEKLGFLPFFRNCIPGFSIAECCPPELWFSDTVEGPWEWKGPVIRSTGCAYGKFFGGKACYISREWFCDFANFRRDGYDYDARIDDGLARNRDLKIMQALTDNPTLLSTELKAVSCQGTESLKRFDSCLTFLQMQGYILTSDFEYMTDKNGKKYGWGVARYATPEIYFGDFFRKNVYIREPEESRARIFDHFMKIIPDADEKLINRFIG